MQIDWLWKELFKLQGTALKMGTAYHKQTNGQTKVINYYLEIFSRCYMEDQPR